MAENPYMHLMIQSGLYDGATTYFEAKYTMWQIDRVANLKIGCALKVIVAAT